MCDRDIRFAVAIIASSYISISPPSFGQGLKGAYSAPEIQGRLTYVKGENDQDRWKNFVSVQPKLIGKSLAEVDQALCGQLKHKAMSEVEYGLTQEPVNIGKNKFFLHIKVVFRNGLACKYSVESTN